MLHHLLDSYLFFKILLFVFIEYKQLRAAKLVSLTSEDLFFKRTYFLNRIKKDTDIRILRCLQQKKMHYDL